MGVRGQLGGRYRLEEPIGDGGMGRVYRAHDALLDRAVAVKLIAEPALEERSVAEARAAARLSHPGIVQVYDVGVQDDVAYIVMELVPGQCLRDVLHERGILPPGEAVDLALQVADALDATHRHGLVHCDVKPLNIIVTPSGYTKLVDFGIARATAAARAGHPEYEIRGSIAYVSPEQARGEALDARSDVYALGAVLYEMLVGRRPFDGAGSTEMLNRRLVSDPTPPRVFEPRIPPELERVVMRSLSREQSRRYANAGEMHAALRAAMSSASNESPAHTQVMGRVTRSRQSAVAAAVGAIFLVAVLAIGGWQLTHRGSDGVPKLVGRQLSEVPMVLEKAGIAPADVTVLTRPVEAQYVGVIVDQQPQPGLPRDADGVQIAVGVAQQ